MLRDDACIKNYINAVCCHIKNHDAHKEITMELENHITEIAEEYISEGMTENEAVARAVKQMGDAALIGRDLNRIHKPKPDLGIVCITLLLMGIGLMTMFIIWNKGYTYFCPKSVFTKALVFNCLGIIAAAVVYFLDYRKLKPYSMYIYLATIILDTISVIGNRHIDGGFGLMLGPLKLNFIGISPVIFGISLSGMVERNSWKGRKKFFLNLGILMLPLIILMAGRSWVNIIIYTVLMFTIMFFTKLKNSYIFGFFGIGLTFIGLLIMRALYIIPRLAVFIDDGRFISPERIYDRIVNLMSSVGVYGKGFPKAPIFMPELHTNLIFTFIVFTFGLAAALFIAALIIAFLVRIIYISKLSKNDYGRMMCVCFTAIFGVQFFLNILMSLGLAPSMDISLPFMSYGGFETIANMIMVGFILSIYKRNRVAV